MKKRMKKSLWIKWLGPMLMIAALVMLIAQHAHGSKEIAHMRYADFWQAFLDGRVRTVAFGDDTLKIELSDGTKANTSNPQSESLRETLLLGGVDLVQAEVEIDANQMMRIGCVILLLSGIFFAYNRKEQTKVCYKQTKVQKKQTGVNVGFMRVAGQNEAVESLRGIVSYLSDDEKYRRIGARMPHGVLFYGPPGTGKTLLARAVAEEADVPIFYASGSDFVQMYVGVGAKRIRELFANARKNEKSIIFIDEIDAIGRKRSDGQDAERDQTLNALLTEMSSFHNEGQVLVIGATNRPDMLDDALTRPGRFDRKIEVAMPDKAARLAIIEVLSREKQLVSGIDLDAVAEKTVGFSGAALENMLNEAAFYAVAAKRTSICAEDIDHAICTVVAGEERSIDDDTRRRDICAVHESGHVLAAHYLFPSQRICMASIIPTTRGAGGYVLRVPFEGLLTKDYFQREVMLAYAGRAAEQYVFGLDAVTQAAAGDIVKATELLHKMAYQFGMLTSDVLLDRNGTDPQAEAAIRSEARLLYEKTLALMQMHAPLLFEIRNQLMEHGKLHEDQLNGIFDSFS